MKNYIVHHPWKIIEEGFDPSRNEISESLFSLGNGWMGQRANFEEDYSGPSLQGSYVAGVYYPDKTRVGWWKNGYPEYFAKVLNSANWIGIRLTIENESLDLSKGKVTNFKRELDMQHGLLTRSFDFEFSGGQQVHVHAQRFCSMDNGEIGAIAYQLTPKNFSGQCSLESYIDFDVVNKDSNYDEKFWEEVSKDAVGMEAYVIAKTKKLDFHVAAGMIFTVQRGDQQLDLSTENVCKEKYAGIRVHMDLEEGKVLTIHKTAAILSSENHEKSALAKNCKDSYLDAHAIGYEALKKAHAEKWKEIWSHSDITIEGDDAAQQGIRFNIFQLFQTYTGHDERLNIGPKGFTGEKYGGSTYWDTEAYCLPFFLGTANPSIARNLLVYRYKHLPKAIENAEKLGFTNGAALYPMVTMNGEECHNEWEITFEEIHRNGAIAYAIWDYTNYTGDKDYLATYGIEVLIGISRFWAQRINWSEDRKKYVMLGVTGPNEYENNVNNNWYTNTIAVWCLKYTIESINWVSEHHPDSVSDTLLKVKFHEEEINHWKDIIEKMYYPKSEALGVFLQQDGFLDKEQVLVKDLDPKDRPLNQKWSWDRILRSVFIKQADVLQGLYFFEEDYDLETHQHNFDFYEPRTVHESSLSPCVHSILAAKLGYQEKAYEMYLRTARLDLDNYNNDTEDGLHITSMAGSWLSIVKGFAGMRVKDGELHFNPFIPKQWKAYSFKIVFRGSTFKVTVDANGTRFENLSEGILKVHLPAETIEVGR